MFKIYIKLVVKNFLKQFLIIILIFSSLIFIMNLLEEINFFKNTKAEFYYPYLLTLLNLPITLFEIFPFIFLISTQLLLYNLFKNKELDLLKINGITNFTLVKILFLLSIFIGLLNITIYYNIASKLKFHYLSIKNQFSNDNKYLAMVIDSGIWIKDDIDNKTLIIKSKQINNKFLIDTIIIEFNINFELVRTIRSNKIDISTNNWTVYNPLIVTKNQTETIDDNIFLKTNFDITKINNLFSNIGSLNMFELITLKQDYEKFGYSTNEIKVQLYKIITAPLFYGIITIFSIIIMFNFTKSQPLLFLMIIGVLLSVIIYYINFIFHSMGTNDKIPIYLSILFPLLILLATSSISLIRINEK